MEVDKPSSDRSRVRCIVEIWDRIKGEQSSDLGSSQGHGLIISRASDAASLAMMCCER